MNSTKNLWTVISSVIKKPEISKNSWKFILIFYQCVCALWAPPLWHFSIWLMATIKLHELLSCDILQVWSLMPSLPIICWNVLGSNSFRQAPGARRQALKCQRHSRNGFPRISKKKEMGFRVVVSIFTGQWKNGSGCKRWAVLYTLPSHPYMYSIHSKL